MTTDFAVMERALTVMAIGIAIQTLMMVGAAIAAFLAYRQAKLAIDQKVVELQGHMNQVRAHIDRVADTVDEAASAVRRGTIAVSDVVEDARDALGRVRTGVATMAAVATAPRTAVAIGVLQGVQWWRRRRAAERLAGVGAEL